MKVDLRADVSTIPLSQYRSLFPKHLIPNGSLKPHTLRSTQWTWSTHDSKTVILRIITTQVQHKTTPDIIFITFYVFEDSTRPFTLQSYPASVHLGIVKFKVPNKASSHAVIDTILNTKEAKQVTFSTPLHTNTSSKKKTNKNKSWSHFLSLSILSRTNCNYPLFKTMRCRRSSLFKTIAFL